MPTPPLQLEDIFAEQGPGKKKPAAPESDAFDLESVFSPPPSQLDTAMKATPPAPTPAPRRGIFSAIHDFLGYHEAPQKPVEGPAPTPEQEAAGARAAGNKLIAGAAAPSATATPTQTYVKNRTGAVVPLNEQQQHDERLRQQMVSTEQANATPEHWREIAKRGMELGSQLHAEGKHEEANEVLRKAYNAQLLAQSTEKSDTFGNIVRSSALGIVKDPFAAEKRNIDEISQQGMTFSPEEQQRLLGVRGATTQRGFDITKDIAAPAVGQLPLLAAGGAVGRTATAILGAGLERAGAETIGQGLGRLARGIEVPEVAGPRIPTSLATEGGRVSTLGARISEEVQALRTQLPSIVGRGATEGQIVGGVATYREARQRGATPEQALAAVAEGIVPNAALGVTAETGLGLAGRAAGLGYDPIRRAFVPIADKIRGAAADVRDRFGGIVTPTDEREQVQLGPEPPSLEAKRGELAGNMDQLLAGRRQETQRSMEDVFAGQDTRPAGPEFWENIPPEQIPRETAGERIVGPRENVVEPPQGPLQRAPEGTLRTAQQIAMGEPVLQPHEEANAFHQMVRAQETARAETAARESAANEMLNHPDFRLERAAQERPGEQQGPLTLAQTLEGAARGAEQGEPLAQEYHQAINDYADAAAAIRDAGENGPSTKAQVALARARQALDAARTRYGKQFGASAVLALAASNSDLTDEEKKMVGLGGLAILSTDIVKHGEIPPERGFVSRLRQAIEDRTVFPKKWDEARPAADWIGKLSGSNAFSKKELELLRPRLEEAQQQKVKLTRASVAKMAEDVAPQIERITLGSGAGHRVGEVADLEGDANDIHDIDEFSEEEQRDPGYIQQQIANRQTQVTAHEEDIERQQSEAQEAMDDAERTQRRRLNELHETLDKYGLSHRVADDAIDYIHEHVEDEYVPRDTIDKAMAKIQDDLYDARPDDENVLKESGYKVKQEEREVYKATYTIDGVEHEEEFTLEPNETEADLRKHIETENPSAQEIQLEQTDVQDEWVVYDSGGDERARGDDEQEVMREAVERDRLGEDSLEELFNDVRRDLDDYADATAEWRRAESEHYYRTEGDAFDEEHSQINTLQEEISRLEDMHDDAVDYQAEQARLNDQTEQRRALEAAGQTTMFPEETGRPPGEPVAVVEAPPEEQPERNIIPQVHGSPQYASYQRIGGGTNYREMLNVWSNKPDDPYTQGHYSDYSNVVGHVRAEDHTIQDTPDVSGSKIEFREGEPEVIRTTKAHVIEKRKDREKLLAQMADIAQQYAQLSGDEATGERAHEMARKYERLNQQANDLSNREDELLAKLRNLQGSLLHQDSPPPKKVAVMIESQSDWAQQAGKYGVKGPPPTPEQKGALRVELGRRQQEWQQATSAFNRAQDTHDVSVREFIGLMNSEQGTGPEGWRAQYHEAVREKNAEHTLGRPDETGRPYDHAIPGTGDILNPYYSREWALLGSIAPEVREGIDKLRATRQALDDASLADSRARERLSDAQDAVREIDNEGGGRNKVPASPYITGGTEKNPVTGRYDAEGAQAVHLNAARFLMDAAERGYSDIAWSDAANRVKNAGLGMDAARVNYDEQTPSAMKKLLGALGFKDVPMDKIYIKGNGHWHMELTPEMRKAIRRAGLPLLGVMAIAGSPDEAQAQDGKGGSGDVYKTLTGGIAAGAALMYLAQHRKVRRIVKENRALERALDMDELSGLANKRAFARARDGVDADDKYSWAVFDGDRFKKMNDVHGHAEGDKAIQHFGRTVMTTAKDMDIPMRGFRNGGDEIAFAVPKEHAAEFIERVEKASKYTKGDVTTQLTGGLGDTFESADAQLLANKRAKKAADASLLREGETVPELPSGAKVPAPPKKMTDTGGAILYSNPVGPALKELARYPQAAALAGAATLLADSDNKDLKQTAMPIYALAALSAIGSRRIGAGKDFLADKLLQQLRKSSEGTAVARFFNPDALLHPEVRDAILRYENDRSRAAARGQEFASQARKLGGAGDRAVSDVLEGEQWEDTSNMSAKDLTAVLTFASALDAEYQGAAKELLDTKARSPEELLAGYAGPRRYAYHEAQAAQAEGKAPGGKGGATRISQLKTRTLDEPIRAAEAALAEAKQGNDAKAIQDAQDKLDEAHAVQQSRRVELGEIRESSYRAAQGIERAYSDAAAARLFGALKDVPGVVHPEWKSAADDLQTAKQMLAAAKTPADRDAAKQLRDAAIVKINDLRRQFDREGGDFVSLPDSRSMGLLRGAVVQRDVANSINGVAKKGTYAKLLRAWKEVKTVFNPGTHQGNILSNIVFSHMEGLPMWEQPAYLKKAAADLRSYGPAARALSEAGIMDVNAVNAESEGVAAREMHTREGLEGLLKTTRPETKSVLEQQGITEAAMRARGRKAVAKGAAVGAALGAAKLADDENPEDSALGGAAGALAGGLIARRGLKKSIRGLYSNEDNIFRAAIWLKKVKGGMTPEQATAYTREALGNFRSRSPALAMARSTVAPFVLYPAKVLPRFAKQVVDHPWRYASLIALWGGLNELSKRQVGATQDSDLPPGQRRALGYALPGFTQLPFSNARGEKAGVDVSRWTPVSAATTAAPPGSLPASFDERIPDVFRAGGPVVDLAARFGANVDPYTGNPAYARDYPPRQNIAHLLRDVAGVGLPSALDFHAERIKEDVQNRDTDKLKNDLLGPTGLRPRFIRPGANLMQSRNILENSLREMKQDFRRAMMANQNEARVPVLRDRYLRQVQQALDNFRRRAGMEPPADLVHDALSGEQ
ncbi:MAG TPA: diguanylate cyclase [Candidatus Saccharimonadales bacterium]|jgi:diguanylate cyclase (GGDEF)-like protein|nr:diguanylate cyclase [Candidatus Saccharimonadales bacterium]